MTRSSSAVRALVAVLAATATALAACDSGSTGTGRASPEPTSGPLTSSPFTSSPFTSSPFTSSPLTSGPLTSGPAGSPSRAALPRPAHVLVVVMENHGFGSVIGSPAAPWLNSLPAASLTDWHGVTHPSQPNYLALFSGSTQGVVSDSCPHTFATGNLGSQLIAAGLSFAGYSEGLPIAGAVTCGAGRYARKHNPWADFSTLPSAANQPLTGLPTDFATLPTVSFVVPDLCHDTHDCSVATGDAWLHDRIGPYLTWASGHDSLLVITYDEDEDTLGNRIPTLLAGPMVRPGSYPGRGDHYTLLRTIEAMYGLAPLGRAAGRRPLSGIWR